MSSLCADLKIRSDQFDIRLNCETDERLQEILSIVSSLWDSGTVRYIHCTNIEIGENPTRGSFGKRHVHIALVLYNWTTVMSISKKFLCQNDRDSWYIVARDKNLPISGWISYHGKSSTKLDPSTPWLFKQGELPTCRTRVSISESKEQRSENKLSEKYEQWKRKEYLVKREDYNQLDREFPGFRWTTMFRQMKATLLKQSNRHAKVLNGPLDNYIIWGDSGTGKSSSVSFLYPNCYKKQKGTQYWDGYDTQNPDHEIVWIDEMSKETLATLTGKMDGGFEFLKELADRYPVTVDEKFQVAFKIRPKKLIITMNEHPTSLLPDRAVEVNKRALFRKFNIMHVNDWLAFNGLRNTPQGVQPFSNLPSETDGERIFNERCIKRAKRSEDDCDQSNRSYQDASTQTKGTLSEVLPVQRENGSICKQS